jgi:hypothetical protein
MTLMVPRPRRIWAFICGTSLEGASALGADFDTSNSNRTETNHQPITTSKQHDAAVPQHQICIECAMPLQHFEREQCFECTDFPKKIHNEWLRSDGLEIVLILGLCIACAIVCFWIFL